ncbi:MAG: hypothetical protein E2O40_06110 [Planctomycetota bacterium]|nr:MAG: hypothetical protein E2O40_06110 [Planctomycetota bacterium]
MQGRTIVWTLLFVLGGLFLVLRATTGAGMARVYVKPVPIVVGNVSWTDHELATPGEYAVATAADPNQTDIVLSFWRTFGVWVAALFTLAIFSFLYSDNTLYKVAESIVIGVSAAYWMVVGFWDVIVPNLMGKLVPDMVKAWAIPGLKEDAEYLYLIPLVLGVMLLCRLGPKSISWWSRWPLAFFIGVFCGLRLVHYLHGNFLNQIRNAIVSLVIVDNGSFDFWGSVRSVILVGGVLCGIVYFFFSFEHKGIVGRIAKVGIWLLMITFGAGFGYTVMGRIALLAIRLEFLFDDWLWLIDPTGQRIGIS